ncbi:hypothetical protein SAMN05216559_0451 [Halomicrobium zhouii]|uniref:Uncharacterized protein n=1 Tax=Halomicrobium zhouii TaxID=767519 RepID=A0A1I6KBB8_9EURY|nr:hypothetical protein [Halomicrobium zhouii]SFR88160.1 hypothetical protein SAMN05216559_0451 [Halomicrobium zhouii]
MVPSFRTLLLGPPEHRFQRRLDLVFAVGLFLCTFLAYAVGLFEVTGGVVFLAMDAAIVGTIAAATMGYRQSGLIFGWLAAYMPLLGANADHYLLGLSSRPLIERLVAFLSPDGLVFLGVAAVVLGTLSWAAGLGGERVRDAFRDRV